MSKKTAVAFCTPMPFLPGTRRLEPITVEWHRARMSLGRPTSFIFTEIQLDGMEVGEARSEAIRVVMDMKPSPPEYLFFLDYDVLPLPDALPKLFYRAQTFKDHDIFCGVYCSKSNPAEPLIYHEYGVGPYWDWAVGDLLYGDRIIGCHMGLTLIRTSLFSRMLQEDPGEDLFVTVNQPSVLKDGKLTTVAGTEDLYFCELAKERCNAKIFVDTSVLAAHIRHDNGQIFGLPPDSPPIKRSKWMPMAPKEEDENGTEKLALDLGAGASRRRWEGYRTETTDIRGDVGADRVLDTRYINLPDDYADLVASSHHLEHIPRWDQERVWSEMFRICKPGGLIEHIVPNLQWAAAKAANGEEDEDVYNVLYGSQENKFDGPRDFNTHYFGYTPGVAKALAEQAGFVDIVLSDYRTNKELGLNLIITGKKPEAEEASDA